MAYTPPVDWKDQDATTALTAARMKAMESALATYTDTTAVPKTLVDAKGDLLVGAANDTVAKLAIGANNTVLTADSAATNGVKWAVPTGGTGGGSSVEYFATDYSLNPASAQTAINLAGNAAAIAGGGVVRVPAGFYTLTGPINHGWDSRVFWDLRGCTFNLSGAGIVGLLFNPRGSGGVGKAGGGALGGVFNCSGAQIGVKFRNANNHTLYDTKVTGGGTGVLFSNDGAGGYTENVTCLGVSTESNTSGFRWESINGGDVSMEGQLLLNCSSYANAVGWDIDTGTSMENVEMSGCRIMCTGVNAAQAIRTRGNLKGWKVSVSIEKLITGPGTDCVVMNTDAGTTNNNLAEIRMHILPQTTGAGQTNTWAAAPFTKHASIALPTIVNDGPVHMMQSVLGGYIRRARRDFEATDRMRESYGGIEWGPGGGTALDSGIGRGGPSTVTTVTSGAPFGCNIVALPATAGNQTALGMQLAGTVVHGTNASAARPTAFPIVQWVGSATPSNAVNGDIWVDTT